MDYSTVITKLTNSPVGDSDKSTIICSTGESQICAIVANGKSSKSAIINLI